MQFSRWKMLLLEEKKPTAAAAQYWTGFYVSEPVAIALCWELEDISLQNTTAEIAFFWHEAAVVKIWKPAVGS